MQMHTQMHVLENVLMETRVFDRNLHFCTSLINFLKKVDTMDFESIQFDL